MEITLVDSNENKHCDSTIHNQKIKEKFSEPTNCCISYHIHAKILFLLKNSFYLVGIRNGMYFRTIWIEITIQICHDVQQTDYNST